MWKVEHLITVAVAAADITPSKCEKAASSVKLDMTLQLGDKKYAKSVKFDPSPLMCEAVKLDNSSGWRETCKKCQTWPNTKNVWDW